MDFPEPGGPTINKWCRPAAAISRALFALSCPLTSCMSLRPASAITSPGCAASMGRVPLRCWISAIRLCAAITCVPSTHAASAPHSWGQKSAFSVSAACRAAGSAPMTGLRRPSSDNSPSDTASATSSAGMISRAASIAKAMARSKCEPILGTSAGIKFMVMRLDGSAMTIALRAALILSFASDTALSGKPTIVNCGNPGIIAHSTVISRGSKPSKATVCARVIIGSVVHLS